MRKLFIVPGVLLLTSCATQQASETVVDPLPALTRQVALAQNSTSYATYWDAYLESPQSLSTIASQQSYLEEMAAVESGQKSCDAVDWNYITGMNTISLLPHLSAVECYEAKGDVQRATYHQNIFNFIATGILSSKKGDSYYSAYEVASWGDSEDLLSLSGYEIIDSYFEFAPNRNWVYRIYNVRAPDTGKVSKVYFDNSRFLHRLLEVRYPFAGLSDLVYSNIIQPLAESDYAARHAVGNVFEAEKKFTEAEQAYLDAIAMGSVMANISLGNMCLRGNTRKFSQNECAQLFVAAADLGLEEAKVLLAYISLLGIGIDPDPELSGKLLNNAAKFMDAGQAEYMMAVLLTSGEISSPMEELAWKFIQTSAGEGSSLAIFEQASSYLNAEPEAVENFERLIRQASDAEQPSAQFLYSRYLLETGEESRTPEGIALLNHAANAGFPPALYRRAQIAETGLYQQPVDHKQAVKDYEAAAIRWHQPAQFRIGVLHSTGTVVKKNHEIAYGWYALCTKLGNLNCTTNLGSAFALGAGVKQDYKRAVKIYEYAASQGSARAKFRLANLYLEGQGVQQNSDRAIEYYTQAAEGGSIAAMNTLGLFYLNIKWEQQDYTEALKWFERAAENKSMYGYFNLARMYEEGLGVESSQAHAQALLQEASSLGHATSSLKLAKAG